MQLIALARDSLWFPRVARLALFTRGKRKFAGANWCQVSLHCQLRITATITRGIQAVLSMERQYITWNGVIPGPFYRGIPSLTFEYSGKLLSFSTWDCMQVKLLYQMYMKDWCLSRYKPQDTVLHVRRGAPNLQTKINIECKVKAGHTRQYQTIS